MKKLIEKALNKNKRYYITHQPKIVILSDFHLGAGWANDDSLKNNLFMFEALKYYYDNGYIVILDGDTFDLAENKDIILIEAAHEDIAWILGELYKDKRLYYIRGNHDAYISSRDLLVRKSTYTKNVVSFLPNIDIYDQVDVIYGDKHYVVLHGHQVDFLYNYFNKIICFFVGLWGKMERFFAKDPTGALGSLKDFSKEIEEYEQVAEEKKIIFVCGHTHSVVLDRKRYFNVGAGVLPRCITCGEIVDGEYTPYKWSYIVKDKQVFVDKTKLC